MAGAVALAWPSAEAEGKGERSGNWEAGGRVFMDGLGHGPRSLAVTGAGGGGGLVGGCRRARHTHSALAAPVVVSCGDGSGGQAAGR